MNKEVIVMNSQDLKDLIEDRLVDETTSDNVLYVFDNKQELLKYKKQCLERHYCIYDKIFATIDDILHGRLAGYRYKRYVFIKGDSNVREYDLNKHSITIKNFI